MTSSIATAAPTCMPIAAPDATMLASTTANAGNARATALRPESVALCGDISEAESVGGRLEQRYVPPCAPRVRRDDMKLRALAVRG
jgi:hypothetical protein